MHDADLGQLADLLNRAALSPHAAGLVGSLLSLRFAECGLKANAFSFASGVAAWLYVAPYMTRWLGLQSDFGPSLIAFLCGLFGAKAVVRAVAAFEAFDWTAIAASVLPGRRK